MVCFKANFYRTIKCSLISPNIHACTHAYMHTQSCVFKGSTKGVSGHHHSWRPPWRGAGCPGAGMSESVEPAPAAGGSASAPVAAPRSATRLP